MAILPNRSGSAPAAGDGTCPYLGIAEDPQTCLSYPSAWNLCHHVRYPATVRLEYQRTTCLAPFHTTCPVYKRARGMLLPARLRGRRAPSGSRGRLVWLVLLALAVGFGLWAAWGRLSGMAFPAAAEASLETTPSDAPPVLNAALTNETLGGTEAPSAAIQVGMSPTAPGVPKGDSPPGPKHCGLELGEGFDVGGYEFVLHRVAYGENMNVLAADYETSLQAIQAANYFLPSPLWADLVIVVPVGSSELSGLPFFEPYFVLDPVASLDELAQQVASTPSELVKYNRLDEGCPAYADWLLLPHAEKKNP